MSLDNLDGTGRVAEDNKRKTLTTDEEAVHLLGEIFKELKKMNIQLAYITDLHIENGDLADG